MKPKRRVTLPTSSSLRRGFSPQSVGPRSKRRRKEDSISPVRRKVSSVSDSVRPPPEFKPFKYETDCPQFMKLLEDDIDSDPLLKCDLIRLQYDLEAMLAHSVDYRLRAQRELAYLNSGDYPTQNLRARPMPLFRPREEVTSQSPTSPVENDEKEEDKICGLPVDENEDDIDVWPPHHIPTRFWTWCKLNFMEPFDSDAMKEFKSLMLDPCTTESLKPYYINEPWKYRKRNGKMRSTPNSSCAVNARKRRSSCDDRKKDDKQEKEKDVRRSARSHRERVPSVIGNVVNAVCREMKKENEMCTPSRRHSERLQSREEHHEIDRKLSIKVEPMDCNFSDAANGDDLVMGSPGRMGNSPKMSVTSPRIKMEIREEMDALEFNWDSPAPSCLPSTSNGRCNGDSTTPRRKNGEARRQNGIHSTENGHSSVKEVHTLDESDTDEDVYAEDVETYKNIGKNILDHLIEKGLVPEYAAYVYGHLSKADADVEVSVEGKDASDDSELDEVSDELLRCQQELKELEPDLRGITEHCWHKVKKDFAYWETAIQLDEADHDLFRLGVNMYKEVPRRQPGLCEWPILRAGMRLRNRKARAHYGPLYKRMPAYYSVGPRED